MTLPTAPSRTMDQDTFDTTVDVFIGALPGFETDMNVLANTVANDAAAAALSETNAATSETAAALSETNAAASAALAGSYATAEAWVSGTTYAYGDIVISPANARIYRRIVAGAGTTDPSLDPTNWSLSTVDGTVNDVVLNAVDKTYHTPVSTTIVQNIVYDTREDSEGGATRKACQHLAMYKETIYGTWLEERANEAAARAVTGATTNDYYHNTTDGKYYALDAGSGQTEVFRGNRREPPEQGIIVAEPGRAIIYDATDSSIPMWAVFKTTAGYSLHSGTITSIAYKDGKLIVGMSTQVIILDLYAGTATKRDATNKTVNTNNLASRNSAGTWANAQTSGAIVSNTVNSVAITTLPDAPIDSATGLPKQTYAIGTDGGVSVIQNTGTVVNSLSTSAASAVLIDKHLNLKWSILTNYQPNAGYIGTLTAGFGGASATQPYLNPSTQPFNAGTGVVPTPLSPKTITADNAVAGSAGLTLYRMGQPAGSVLQAAVTKDYNSGWMVGDIRGAFLANSATVDRSVHANALTENGTVPVTTNSGGLSYFGPFTAANNLTAASNAEWDVVTTGAFYQVGWFRTSGNSAVESYSGFANAGNTIRNLVTMTAAGLISCIDDGATAAVTTSSTAAYDDGSWHQYIFVRESSTSRTLYVDGVAVASNTTDAGSLTGTGTLPFAIGVDPDGSTTPATTSELVLARIGATAITAEQAAYMYATEKRIIDGTTCLLAGTSNAVTALGYDKKTELLDVYTSYGRSTFKDLQLVESEATTVGAPGSGSAYDGTRLQAGTTAKVTMPTKYLRDELYRAAEDAARQADSQTSYSFTSSGTTQELPQGMKATGGVMFNSTDATHSVPVQTFDGFVWTLTGLTNAKVYNLMIRRA